MGQIAEAGHGRDLFVSDRRELVLPAELGNIASGGLCRRLSQYALTVTAQIRLN